MEPRPRVVEIPQADPVINKRHHDLQRSRLIRELMVPNTTVVLGPNVVIDFTDARDDELPLLFGACVTLTSAPAGNASGGIATPSFLAEAPAARSPRALGPLLRFGPHRSDAEKVFLEVNCRWEANDNVRISGFRVHGPSFGQQEHDDIGIHVVSCVDIEISNMEIAGWGGQAIHVVDESGPAQAGRIDEPSDVRIFRNYIHHNQHPREGVFDSHAGGYGASVSHGAWAQIHENVFDFNRHAIAAAGDMGGYEAVRNLVLKGGGYHYAGFHTHQFDIHGTGDNGFGGQGGVRSLMAANSFQYLADNAIGIRGRPSDSLVIRDNVFAHEGLEDDAGDDAIALDDRDWLDVIQLGPNNVIDVDSYGRYGVCDFDGDGTDDLFLATGKTWWFSSYGEFQWTYLAERIERLEQVRLGYFDGDNRCDVLTENSDGAWVIASGGVGFWQSIGHFGTPLSEVTFGQFDPNVRDHRPGVTRRTSHALRRTAAGTWQVTPLSAPDWRHVQSSSLPMNRLRFGDFTGDGVTDVLSVQNGRWSISESGRGGWQRLNANLGDDVRGLLIADLAHDNISDLIRLQTSASVSGPVVTETLTWWVSDDGRSPWRKLKSYVFLRPTLDDKPQLDLPFASRDFH